jgi:hypothetical protein
MNDLSQMLEVMRRNVATAERCIVILGHNEEKLKRIEDTMCRIEQRQRHRAAAVHYSGRAFLTVCLMLSAVIVAARVYAAM